MDASVYVKMAEHQDKHWWFKARRHIIKSVLVSCIGDDKPKILEIGCGPGGNLALLSQLGEVRAIEMDNYARHHATQLSGIDVDYGMLPDHIPYDDTQFDLVCLFDVLEHIEDDNQALINIKQKLTCDGKLILTVPAFQWLFSKHDQQHHHYRRYSKKELQEKLLKSGFRVEKISYFNMFLFPLALISRVLDALIRPKESLGVIVPPRPFNSVLYRIFKLESHLLPHFNFPFGLSLLVVATKNEP